MTSTFTALSHVGDLPCVFVRMYVSYRFKHACTLQLSECDEGCNIPGSLSSIVMNAMLGAPISTTLGWSAEIIATLKYSDSSVVLSSMVDTIKVACI